MPVRGVGIGFRPALAGAMLASPGRFDFVEVVAEACNDARARREAVAVAEVWPAILHGVKMSLGSTEGIDDARAASLGALARDLRAPFVSEHIAFVRAGGREIGHLTELPMTRATVAVVARNVARLRRHLPDVPLLLENIARTFLWDASSPSVHEMTEGQFCHEIVAATGCDLLLDVANLYANATNCAVAPADLLARFPLERIALVHVAGGSVDGGFYFDTHADPVPAAVFDLVAQVRAVRPDVGVMLERDGKLDDVRAIFEEVDRLRLLERSDEAAPPTRRSSIRPSAYGEDELARAQVDLAAQLTALEVDRDASAGLLRARSILARKRAEAPSADSPRDRLCQRARFAPAASGTVRRLGPWIGRAALSDGKTLWALKGIGREAAVRLYEH